MIIKNRHKSLTIVLDAGHGGSDSGVTTQGAKGRITEKDFTLQFTQLLGKKLTEAGHTVYYTRTADTYPSLSARVVAIKSQKPDVLLSIHGEAFVNSKPRLISSIVFHVKRPVERKLSQAIAESLEQEVKERVVVATDDHRGTMINGIMMLRESPCPATTISIGDMPRASQPELQEKLVAAIVSGVQKYAG
jgi:N-acetylmuramoyl-L-alanine amidase